MITNRLRYKLFDKREKKFVCMIGVMLAANGELYADGLNVTQYFDIVFSTGKCDKNGYELYEGDIVGLEDANKYDAQIVWNDELASYGCKIKGATKPYCDHLYGIEHMVYKGSILEIVV